ncbi:hypothetical protein TNCV_1212861 [Trichonephila clavipes]|nr:hypothetical protein TNCV_1212861 [Trichonephila clavipes]
MAGLGIAVKANRKRVTLVLPHIRTLESNLKPRCVYQGSLKYALSDSQLEIKLAIPFVPHYDPEDNPQQGQLGDFAHYLSEWCMGEYIDSYITPVRKQV